MGYIKWQLKTDHNLKVLNIISKIKDKSKRNLLRGYVNKTNLNKFEILKIRKGNNLSDCMMIGAAMKGEDGLLKVSDKPTSSELYTMITPTPLSWREELSYLSGYINSFEEVSLTLLKVIKSLSCIEQLETETTLNLIMKYSEKYGASNFLSYKLAYVISSRELSSNEQKIVTQIEDEFGHREKPGFHFSALENLNSRISLFVVARRRVSALIGKVDGNIRKAISLNNFIPTPLSFEDLSEFFLRASESALIDAIYSLIIIFNLDNEFLKAKEELEKRLSPELINEIKGLISFTSSLDNDKIVTNYYRSLNEDGDFSLDLYRNSAAFLERKELAKYRNKIDKVVGARLLNEIEIKNCVITGDFNYEKSLLLANDGEDTQEQLNIKQDTFYRTFLFLKILRNRNNILSLTGDNIKFIFENTLRLDTLLTEDEMQTLFLTSPENNKSLVTVLTLALFRKKSVDPDIDFDFRIDFISYVKEKFDGSIVKFISDLLENSPSIASYIVVSLDEVTLEKMYGLVSNASEASSIRREILTSVGKKLNQIEYIIEAESINTREKVSKLQKYFDSSRIYVDSVSMKKWLDSNPTMSTEQYRSLFNRPEAIISKTHNEDGVESDILLIQLVNSGDYLISQIAKDAFEQFCLNNEFGIQSYLGRRIRHNTLDGVTTDTVDAILRKPEHRIVLANLQMQKTVESWLASYKAIVDKLRREYLQFRSSNSLFNAIIDTEDSATSENIRLLTNTLRSTGRSELLNELIIAFCWKQITPQLENAARFIRTTLLQQAKDSIDKHFTINHSSGESQIVTELHEAVNEVFIKVSDWFQVPDTGFISASIKDLCQIILIDLNRHNNVEFHGEAMENKYTGISVHRLYDCLAVLLQNANKHGEDNTIIHIDVTSTKLELESVLESVSVDITSKVSKQSFRESKARIEQAINAEEASTDMVTEGYSGIKKIKFITRANEGKQTMRFRSDDTSSQFTLGFSIHAEIATEENVIATGLVL
ncbi:hypothetical protein [Proteus columbae]|uniref:hypothetical protein n=1 Tax=Proteus columbae TaxID=1987580 RepID=UPI002889D58D|nr:hypothetical protein [Proteus columbae]